MVFIPKFQKKVMYWEAKQDIRQIIKPLCDYKKIKITAGTISVNYVHLFQELPPKYSVSSFMGTSWEGVMMVYNRNLITQSS